MIERALIMLLLVGAGLLVYNLLTRRQLDRAAQTAPGDPLLADVKLGIPTIVYFTTPTCAPCKFQQTPILQHLQTELGEHLRVIRVDATEDPDAATRWGVMTVPTTFVLDRRMQPRSVYNGVVDADTLKRELLA